MNTILDSSSHGEISADKLQAKVENSGSALEHNTASPHTLQNRVHIPKRIVLVVALGND